MSLLGFRQVIMLTEHRFALLFENWFALDMTLCQLQPRRRQ